MISGKVFLNVFVQICQDSTPCRSGYESLANRGWATCLDQDGACRCSIPRHATNLRFDLICLTASVYVINFNVSPTIQATFSCLEMMDGDCHALFVTLPGTQGFNCGQREVSAWIEMKIGFVV